MKLVETLVVRDDFDVIDAHLSYHLNAGVDFVIATVHESHDGVGEVLDRYVRSGHLRVIPESGEARESEWRTAMARLAVTDHEADWVLDADPDDFWWPRGEGMKDALAAIPQRYSVVQGLGRLFLPRRDDEWFAERMIARRSLLPPTAESNEPLHWALRPLIRSDPKVVIDASTAFPTGRVPLRAWYPFEILRFPLRDLEQAERRFVRGYTVRSTLESEARDAWERGRLNERFDDFVVGDAELDQLLDDGTLVSDTRLRDALRTLMSSGGGPSFALPDDGRTRLVFRAPDLVDDAAYAVECAAVGEVDLPRLERQIAELEARIIWLEARFWPRVLRTISRIVRR